MALTESTRAELEEIVKRYPQPRSALNPMLHWCSPKRVTFPRGHRTVR